MTTTTGTGLSGFLVLGRCGLDDVPMRLCATAGEAEACAAALTVGDVREQEDRLFGGTSGITSCVWVVEFRDGLLLDTLDTARVWELEED
jgi:hypothetical protein